MAGVDGKKIALAIARFRKLPEYQKTDAEWRKVFNCFDTAKGGNSKDKLDDSDGIEDFYKEVMGLTTGSSISYDDFCENFEAWAGDLAAPYAKVSDYEAQKLSGKLTNALAPCYGTSAVGAWLGDLVGDDDGRYDDAIKLFGAGSDKINEDNIVEVMHKCDSKVLNRVINTLDDEDEGSIRAKISDLFTARINTLKKTGQIDSTTYSTCKQQIALLKDESSFKGALDTLTKDLMDKGIRD